MEKKNDNAKNQYAKRDQTFSFEPVSEAGRLAAALLGEEPSQPPQPVPTPARELPAALAGRRVDPDSGPRAAKLRKRYKNRVVLWAVPAFLIYLFFFLAFSAAVGMEGRAESLEGAALVSTLSAPFVLPLIGKSLYSGAKSSCYTGNTGVEMPDESGSPFFGKLVTARGHIRPGNFLVSLLLLLLAVLSTMGISYFWLARTALRTDWVGILAQAVFVFSMSIIYGTIFSAMVYGWRYFRDRLARVLRYYLPAFLIFQLAVLLLSSLVSFLLSLLSRSAASDSLVVSFGERVLGGAVQATSVGGFFTGEGSLLSSLSALSLFATLINTIIDTLDEPGHKSFGAQFWEMLKEKSSLRLLLLMAASFLFLGLSGFQERHFLLGLMLRGLFFLFWAFSTLQTIKETNPLRFLFIFLSLVGLDMALQLPEATGPLAILGGVGLFLLRTLIFVVVGLLLAIYFKFTKDTAVYDLTGQQEKSAAMIYDGSMEQLWQEVSAQAAEEERIKREKAEAAANTPSGKAARAAKKIGLAAVKAWFNWD